MSNSEAWKQARETGIIDVRLMGISLITSDDSIIFTDKKSGVKEKYKITSVKDYVIAKVERIYE